MAILINAEFLNLEMILRKFHYFLVDRRIIFFFIRKFEKI